MTDQHPAGPVRRIHAAPGGPAPVGPFSQATVAHGFVFTSGQLPGPGGPGDDFTDQVERCLRTLADTLQAAGSGLEHIVKLNAYLEGDADMTTFNTAYRRVFGDLRPARTTINVGLWGLRMEVDCTAVVPERTRRRAATEESTDPVPTADPDLIAALRGVSFPTLGHFLEDGFVDHRVRAITPGRRIVGPARTLSLPSPDATAVNQAICALRPGDVLIIDTHDGASHAVLGAVTATAAAAGLVAGVVVDGLVTDVVELQDIDLAVHARGTTARTTKLLDGRGHVIDVPVECGGVTVHPGDLVLADDNGVVVLDPDVARSVLPRARASDDAEPALLERLRSGERTADALNTGTSTIHPG